MVTGKLWFSDGVEYYRIDHAERMEPFLMTVVSHGDLWMFVSSTGALTAGRVDADHALFPYQTDDKVHRAAGIVGPVTVIACTVDGHRSLWRPFDREIDAGCTRSIAKSILGDRLVFEELNDRWGLLVRMTWAPSDAHGWVRTVELVDERGDGADLEVLDGLIDVMPAGVDAHTEQIRSNLVDAYKRAEVAASGTLAVYTLESLITDRAEPAEALTATTVWSHGFPGAGVEVDVDARSVAAMIEGRPSAPQELVTGRAGAYLLRGAVTVPDSGSVTWMMVADTGLGHPDVISAVAFAADPGRADVVAADVASGSTRLRALLAGADGFQSTADAIADAHHVSNVLFNSMRGGVFPYGNDVPTADLATFVGSRNRDVAARSQDWFTSLDRMVDVTDLRESAAEHGDPDLIRLVMEYLPLTFSRRHGDPSRPWNRFSIRIRDDHGGELLTYEGNWRDIFQNWEALLQSYPEYLANVVAKFVNATTLDGYNPYRISRDGIDWEVPDPDDPWSHIGYWGDHQIVYLLRLLEAWEQHQPGAIADWLDRAVFVSADVPYEIADHDAIVRDPRNTIAFDEDRAARIGRREEAVGSDGRLAVDQQGALVRSGLAEKLLVPALAKLSNFVPGGGIWLNTQRPEWNDANNALAGPGLSMVTLFHLERYLRFVGEQLAAAGAETVALSSSVASWFTDLLGVFDERSGVAAVIDDRERRSMMDALGSAASRHHQRTSGEIDSAQRTVSVVDVQRLCTLAIEQMTNTIRGARRADGLYHSYNRISFDTIAGSEDCVARVDHLGAMLEGQVAALSSGSLGPSESLELIDALFASGIYRPDQQSFMLYPIVELPSFFERNIVSVDMVADLGLSDDALRACFASDPGGHRYFRPEAINADALVSMLDGVAIADTERQAIMDLYESVFQHASFTGRSASMYGYEGIGSIYWHMVSKLLLAVQETYWSAIDGGAPDDVVGRLADAYRRVRDGLGFRKGPSEFGAFPTDCYSHTPTHAGAQQPGMTGQVKEEILTRFGELGIRVTQGRISLMPGLLDLSEIVPAGEGVPPASFTTCGVPMTLARGATDETAVHRSDGTIDRRSALTLTVSESREVFARDAGIVRVEWTVADRRP